MNAVAAPRRPEVRRTQPVLQKVCRTFVVNIENGLHARPCALLVKALQPFQSTVEVQANNEQASGKSILGLMALGAGCGTRLTFTFVGEDAFEALGAVAEVFEAHFNQGGHN